MSIKIKKIIFHKNLKHFFGVLLFLLTLVISQKVLAAVPVQSLGFQGQLFNNGTAVDASVTAGFQFYDSASGGSPQGSTINKTVTVSKGYFGTDFSEADLTGIDFNQSLWIEVVVEGNTLSPRSAVNAVPFAKKTFGAFSFSSAPAVGEAGSLYFDSGTNQLFVSNGSSWTGVSTSTSPWITSGSDISYTTGKVGVGTTTPSATLAVTGLAGTSDAFAVASSTNANMFVVKNTGNVGIGTTTPAEKLVVFGNAHIANSGKLSIGGPNFTGYGGGLIDLVATTGFPKAMINFRNPGNGDWGITLGAEAIPNVYIGIGGSATGYFWRANWSTAGVAGNTFKNANSLATTIVTANVLGVASQTADLFQVSTWAASTTPGSVLKVTATGEVGIGSTTPNARLTIKGTSTLSTQDLFIVASSSDAQLFTIKSTGFVGIGTTTPSATLAVTGVAGTTDVFAIASSTNTNMFVVKNTGNVGIGTTSPTTSMLAIAGTSGATTDLFSVSSSTGSSSLVIKSTGYVGIGSTTPTSVLAISGATSASGTAPNVLSVIGGTGGSSGAGGAILLQAGTGGSSGAGGAISITAGTSGGTTAGALTLAAGSAGGSGSAGGISTITGGIGGSNGAGGALNLGGGNGAGSSAGGNVYIYGGSSNSSATGTIILGLNSSGTVLGNVGVGTSTPSAKLAVTGLAGTRDIFAVASSTNTNMFVIKNTGRVGIGTTSPSTEFSVVGNGQFTGVTSGTYANDLNLTANGVLTTSASDIRLKENILELSTSTLSKLLTLKTYTFNWINDSEHKTDIGMIAQEVELIFPEITFTNKVDGYKGINYSRLPTLLLRGIQEQQVQIDELKKYATFIRTKELHTEKLCVGTEQDEVCISKDELRQLLLRNSINSSPVPPPASSIDPSPVTDPVIDPVVDPVTDPVIVPEPAPEPTPEPAPAPAPAE